MPFSIVRNDITKVKADIIVNTANPKPIIGGGTDRAVYVAAGEERLLEERKKIGEILQGEAVYTPAFDLQAKYIIHTVGPTWIDGEHGEKDVLRSCYDKALILAESLKAKSIAFPLIATGVYGFPKDEALNIALSQIGRFLLLHDMKVILVVFDRKAFELSSKLIGDIDEYIDEKGVVDAEKSEYELDYGRFTGEESFRILARKRNNRREYAASLSFTETLGKSLEEAVGDRGDTFSQRLFKLIDERGMDDVTVYKKANIDRKVFSRIRCKEDYKPKKKTAVALAVALKLNMNEMLDLLSRAEIAFSPGNKFDIIITYFINNKIYDIYEINAALFKYGQPILGE
ncbi:MAG: macro domain-containing protein [Firmicutes bacterium]|nr:macro domain-containing protein [Bacillota bacterium]